ncbi:hypothetical protein B6D60_02965 [candidate division KSB1 bacterium 4484_87]|nr:MAG: hypothetical protein B6D60_02965 [candidate division KSB1 bacterium 4484_87]
MAFKPSKRSSRTFEQVQLDMTPVMNLMVVLIPLLLTSATFVKIGVIDLNLPPTVGANAAQMAAPKESEKNLDLAVTITEEGFYISSSLEVLKGNEKGAPTIPVREDGSYDFKKLSEKLYEIKKKAKGQFSDTESIVIQANPDIPYQLLVSTMDASRDISVNHRKMTLFPEVSLAAGVI